MARFSRLEANLADLAVHEWDDPSWRVAGVRQAAVLLLLSDDDDPELVFTQRSATLRNHAGQLSFPGGKRDDADASALHTALREAEEEIGLAPDDVHVLGELPDTHLAASSFDVTPVVGWWSGDDIHAASPGEVQAVHRWPISWLADPANRVMAERGARYRGPAWEIDGLFLWGFSALLTDTLLRAGGWWQPWDEQRRVPVPNAFI